MGKAKPKSPMVESLRACASCGHCKMAHAGACGATLVFVDEHGCDAPTRCNCTAYVPGKLSAEGKRADRAEHTRHA